MAEKKEEKKEAAKAEELTPEAAAAKKKKKKLIIIAAAGFVVVAAAGGGAAWFFARKNSQSEKHVSSESAPTNDHSEGPQGAATTSPNPGASPSPSPSAVNVKKPTDIDFGKTMTLAPFHLNLGNPIDNRYVRLEIAIEYGVQNTEIEDELKARMPQLRDAVVSVTRKKSREYLLSPDGTDGLRKELKNAINQFMKKPIDNVYITDILIE